MIYGFHTFHNAVYPTAQASGKHRFWEVKPPNLIVEASAVQLRILIRAIERLDKRIAEVFAQHPEHDLFDSFPGAAPFASLAF